MSKQKDTGIVWTDQTWNPLRGCSHVSPGCDHCYAERMAARFAAEGQPYFGVINTDVCHGHGRWNGRVRLVEERLTDPLRWRKPRRIFVNSMSDLFHPWVPDEWIDRIFVVMALASKHTFQILTKRPDRMAQYLGRHDICLRWQERIAYMADGDIDVDEAIQWTRKWLPNVWIGVTAENQETADERIPLLLHTPAALRFVSVEPMLGPVDLCHAAFNGADSFSAMAGIDWVIVGGESGAGARPMHLDWVRLLLDQCQAAAVPFLFKQMLVQGDKVTLPYLDGQRWNEYPKGK